MNPREMAKQIRYAGTHGLYPSEKECEELADFLLSLSSAIGEVPERPFTVSSWFGDKQIAEEKQKIYDPMRGIIDRLASENISLKKEIEGLEAKILTMDYAKKAAEDELKLWKELKEKP